MPIELMNSFYMYNIMRGRAKRGQINGHFIGLMEAWTILRWVLLVLLHSANKKNKMTKAS